MSGSIEKTKTKTKIDWSKYNKRYKPEWEKLPECQGWLTRALGDDPSRARCKACRKQLRAHLGDIKKHAQSASHKHVMKVTQGGKVKVAGNIIGPKYTRKSNKFVEEWGNEPECEGWLERGEYGARCNVCNVNLMPKLSELKKHSYAKRHLKALASLWEREGMGKDIRENLKPEFQPWQLPEIKRRDFELKEALVISLLHHFRGAREQCAILEEKHGFEDFSLTAQQSKAVFRHILAPYFIRMLKTDMKDSPFSLVFDDVSNMSISGQIAICINYYSRSKHQAVPAFLGCVRIDRNDPIVLVESVVELLTEWEIYGYNLISIQLDGIADICDIDDFINRLAPTCPNVLHLHTNFYALSRAVSIAIKSSLPDSLEFMLRESYNWFAISPERQATHSDLVDLIQFSLKKVANPTSVERNKNVATPGTSSGAIEEEKMEVIEVEENPMKVISPTSSQWLHIADFTTGVFLNYDALKTHFEKTQDLRGCYMSKLLSQEYSKNHNRIYFTVLQPILTHLSQFKKEVIESNSSENPDIHAKVKALFLMLAKKILKPEIVESRPIDEICAIDINTDTKSVLAEEDVDFGMNFETVLETSHLSPTEKTEIKTNAMSFFKQLFIQLQNILQDAFTILKNAEHFQMPKFLSAQLGNEHLVEPFFEQSQERLKDVKQKFQLMKMLDWKCKQSTIMFWQEVHEFGDATGNFPLRILSNGVWKMFCVPLFSVEIAKLFSTISAIRSADSHVEPELLELLLILKTGLNSLEIDIAHFEPPPDLLKMKMVYKY